MKKLIFALSVGAMMLGTANVSARSLSPDEALSMATAQMRKSFGKAQAMQLAYTLPSEQNGQNALYVFANPQGGFAVIAADDVVDQLLLGYSDGTFDADNLAPAFDWYLRASAASVDGQIATATPDRQRLSQAAAQRQPIAPLIATKWDQGDPYNQQCPKITYTVNGTAKEYTSVTGCVATAMAQVMKFHEYPTTGVGSNSYSWSVNGTTYTDALDYSTITFDWANMLNKYTSAATQAQKDAVAQLMHACGNSVDMNYSPNGSSASTQQAANSLIEHFGYDKGIVINNAEWYTVPEWNDCIYAELAEGRPILFRGTDISGSGHAFICDGYSSDDMFHINWGWSGASDGYFILPDLFPATMGTGGGSGASGFNFYQQAFTGIQPDQGGSYVQAMYVRDVFATNKESYTRSETITFTGGFMSASLGAISGYTGIHIVGDGIDQYKQFSSGYISLDPGYYYPQRQMYASSLPLGTYNVYPAFKPDGGEWGEMFWNKRSQPNGLLLTVTSAGVNVSDPNTPAQVDATIVTELGTLITGVTYDIEYTITSDAAYTAPVQVAICSYDETENSVIAVSLGASRTLVFTEAGSQSQTYSVPIASTLESGTYYLALTAVDDNGSIVSLSDFTAVEVEHRTMGGRGKVDTMTYEGVALSRDDADPTIVSRLNTKLQVTMICTKAPWFELMHIYILEPANASYVAETKAQLIDVDAVGNTITFEVDLDNLGLEYDHAYGLIGYGETTYQTPDYKWFFVSLSNDITINDATAYTNDKDIEDVDITYVREFNNTSWQPLYVPFDMEYADWADQAEIAQLEGVIMYDYDHDGTIDRTVVTFTSVTSGTVKANTPYVIKANAEGTATFTVEGATLKAATNNYVDCSTTSHNFYLRGVYETKTGLDLSNEYIMGGGAFYHSTGGVKPMRFYLQKEARGSYGSHAPQRASADGTPDDIIYVEVDGVQTDGIFDLIATPAGDDMFYDLQGRRVVNPTPGIYVRNGKKVIIK